MDADKIKKAIENVKEEGKKKHHTYKFEIIRKHIPTDKLKGLDLIVEYREWEGHYSGMSDDYSPGGCSASVKYKGQEVFSRSDMSIWCYIPGEWEKHIDDLYNEGLKISKQKEKQEKEREKWREEEKLKEEAKKFGINTQE